MDGGHGRLQRHDLRQRRPLPPDHGDARGAARHIPRQQRQGRRLELRGYYHHRGSGQEARALQDPRV